MTQPTTKTRYRAGTAKGVTGKVDRKNGIIYGVAVNTEGEALGHGVYLEREFVEDVVKQGNAAPKGLKSRFGHPNASSRAIGTYLGRLDNFKLTENAEGQAVARADLHLSQSAKTSPNGDLFTYVLDLAENDPDMFGTSIVFYASNYYKRDEGGEKVYRYIIDDDGGYEYNNKFGEATGNVYAELGQLKADDVVDSPAANPSGLFSEFCESPAKAMTQFLDDHPQIWDMFKDVDEQELAQLFSAFKERYNANRGRFGTADKPHKQECTNMSDEKTVDAQVDLEAAKAEASKQTAEHMRSLLSEFSQEIAMDAFDKGLSVEEVKASQYDEQKTRIAELEAEIEQLKANKPAPAAEGETDPVQHSEADASAFDVFNQEVADNRAKGLSQREAYAAATRKYPEIANQIAGQ